jgi:LPXTG-site transpeptidase (sortase) family protein
VAASNASVSSELPSTLLIPALGVNAKVQALGITKKGNMGAPSNFTDVSWFKLGTVPGQVGSAVMAGHEDNALSLDGVFKHLEDLKTGDDVYVVRKDGKKLHFKVVDKKIYPYNLTGPELEKVYNADDAARLNLITCTGNWVQSIKTNDKRLVVFTKLVSD